MDGWKSCAWASEITNRVRHELTPTRAKKVANGPLETITTSRRYTPRCSRSWRRTSGEWIVVGRDRAARQLPARRRDLADAHARVYRCAYELDVRVRGPALPACMTAVPICGARMVRLALGRITAAFDLFGFGGARGCAIRRGRAERERDEQQDARQPSGTQRTRPLRTECSSPGPHAMHRRAGYTAPADDAPRR
jgi:hypothetical protein